MYRLFLLLIIAFMLLGMACSTDEDPVSSQDSDVVLYINELLSTGDPDWIEIYNPGNQIVDISGFYLYDAGSISNKTIFPQGTTVPARGFLVWNCDDIQTNFKLSSAGEQITFEDQDEKRIDQVDLPAMELGKSYGRQTDGGASWIIFDNPSPGVANGTAPANRAPVIGNISVTPETLSPTTEVVIQVEVTDADNNLSTVSIYYGTAQTFSNQADFQLNQTLYQANLGVFNDGSVIYFYIKAEDQGGLIDYSDTLSFQVGYVPPVLYVNEFLAGNSGIIQDEFGDKEDWIEIYNPGPQSVNLAGMYITDDFSKPTAWQIPDRAPDSTTIPAGGFLLFWADKETSEGILHVDIKLSGSGEAIGLFAPNGTTVIDSITFGAQTDDVSYGRYPDGSATWQLFTTPTPRASNQ